MKIVTTLIFAGSVSLIISLGVVALLWLLGAASLDFKVIWGLTFILLIIDSLREVKNKAKEID